MVLVQNAMLIMDWVFLKYIMKMINIKECAYCHWLKTTYTSLYSIKTLGHRAYYLTMDGLTDILVGRTETEDDTFIGYPPRGFEYYVSRYYIFFTISYILLHLC